MAKRVTLYHIAEELGISASTVSRVLNNSTLISDEKSRLIIDKANELGYIPRQVKKQKNRVILNIHLFLPPSQESFIHLFYDIAQLLEGIREGFGDVLVNILTRLNDGDHSFLNKKKTGQIDGCIFAFTRIKEDLREELNLRSIPFIHLNRKDRSSFVAYDNRDEMDRLVQILYNKRGNTLRPCFLGYNKLIEVSQDRFEGVKKACFKRNISFKKSDYYSINVIDDLQEVFSTLVNKKYNAILSFNDIIAMAVLQRARINKIAIPEKISLTGLDNSSIQQLEIQKIDTIDFSVFLLGKEAASWLSRQIIDKVEGGYQKILTGQYIKGKSI
jgi:DNA-binding LacI/PurR family transcriptional regulator